MKGSVRIGGRLREKTCECRVQTRQSSIDDSVLPSQVYGDDVTFAATELELIKIRPKMYEWYDVKVRGVFGSRV